MSDGFHSENLRMVLDQLGHQACQLTSGVPPEGHTHAARNASLSHRREPWGWSVSRDSGPSGSCQVVGGQATCALGDTTEHPWACCLQGGVFSPPLLPQAPGAGTAGERSAFLAVPGALPCVEDTCSPQQILLPSALCVLSPVCVWSSGTKATPARFSKPHSLSTCTLVLSP